MSVPDEIDDLIGVLRSPALPSELADEQRAIADMAGAFHASTLQSSAHQSTEARITMRNTSRRVRVGVLIATGIIGFGGVAAAGPGGVFDNGEASDEVATTTTTTTTEVAGPTTTVATSNEATTTTIAVATTTTLAAAEEVAPVVAAVLAEGIPLVDDPATTFNETMCLEGNHGKTVSAVARGELVIADIDVVDAAHSSCGKDAVEDAEEAAETDESADTADQEAPAKEKKNGDKGKGQGNGGGRGNPHDD